MTKIIILIGDGPESGDELEMYVYKSKPAADKRPKNVFKTTYPTNAPNNFNQWARQIFK